MQSHKPEKNRGPEIPEYFSDQTRLRTLAGIFAIASLYYVTGRLGRTVAPPLGVATVVWPPSGIFLAALLILGNRVWPGIWIGAFLSNDWSSFHPTSAQAAISFLATGASIDTGALLQALIGPALFRRYVGSGLFDGFKQSVIFTGVALGMGFVGASIGVGSL